MNNHFHLYLRTPRPNLSAGTGYASGFNRRWRRCGALFQGRFKAVVVEQDSHTLELSRYLHLNPTRAGIVERPEEWAWSSYPDYLAMRTAPAWLDWQTVVGELGKDLARARPAYRRFMEAGLREPPKSPLATALGGMFLGSAEWVEWWRRRLAAEPVREDVPAQRKLAWRPTLEDVAGVVSEAFGVEQAELCVSRRHGNEARSAAIYLTRQVTDEPVEMIGKHYGGVSMAAISKTVARVESRRQEDRAWDRRLAKLSQRLMTSEAPRNKS